MTPERYRQIGEISQAALELGPDERAAFTNDAGRRGMLCTACPSGLFMPVRPEAYLLLSGSLTSGRRTLVPSALTTPASKRK